MMEDKFQIILNTLWVIQAGILVFFMQIGFACLETGLTRAKNASSILMKNLMDFCVGTLAFWLIGFYLIFGQAFVGNPKSLEGLWQFAFWFFHLVFCATATTIVSGSMAERTKFRAYLICSFIMSGFIYPVVASWVWGGGWLEQSGMIDFAGSTVVHSVGGWAALMGAVMVGPRTGKYNGRVKALFGHNIPLAFVGVFILWMGWFGFNCGSTLAANMAIAPIAVATAIAGACGAITAMLTSWIHFGKPDATMTLNGVLAGLVAITAGCAAVSPVSAAIIGAIAGVIVVGSIELIDKVLRVDDPVGAISVHAICGVWGTLAVGLFAQADYCRVSGIKITDGLFFGGGISQLMIQFKGVAAVFLFTTLTALFMFYLIKKTVGLRVSKAAEHQGLDITEHGMESYSGFQIFSNE
jgi:Amt family ammonium transporter